MLRGLKTTMFVFGAILVLEGGLDIALPAQRAAGLGLGECASQSHLAMAVLGATWIAAGVWTLVAARDPLRHLQLVKLALTLSLALLLALLSTVLRGDIPLRQVAVDLGFDALFAVLFLVFYPRGSATRDTARTAGLDSHRPGAEHRYR